MGVRKGVWLGFLILSLAGISFYGGAVSYGFFFALLMLPAFSAVYLTCVYFRFKIYQETASRNMVCGQPMPYYFVLRNEDYFGFASISVRMFPGFSYVENVAENTEYELLPGDEFRYDTRIICRYRGEYEVGVKEVIVTDFFRIFRLRYPMPGTIKAIVYPKLVEVNELVGMSYISAGRQKEAMTDKKLPDVVVRDYTAGDSLKRIHWKASARAGQLMVRNEIGEEQQGIILLLDTKRCSRKTEEYLPLESKMLEALLALGMFFAKRNMAAHVYYGQRGIKTSRITNLKSFEGFYAQMSGVIFDWEESFLQTLQGIYEQGIFLQSGLVVGILHEINEEILYMAEKLSLGGTNVVLYVVTEENLENYVRQNTERKKIIVIPVQAELEGVL